MAAQGFDPEDFVWGNPELDARSSLYGKICKMAGAAALLSVSRNVPKLETEAL